MTHYQRYNRATFKAGQLKFHDPTDWPEDRVRTGWSLCLMNFAIYNFHRGRHNTHRCDVLSIFGFALHLNCKCVGGDMRFFFRLNCCELSSKGQYINAECDVTFFFPYIFRIRQRMNYFIRIWMIFNFLRVLNHIKYQCVF